MPAEPRLASRALALRALGSLVVGSRALARSRMECYFDGERVRGRGISWCVERAHTPQLGRGARQELDVALDRWRGVLVHGRGM